MRGFPQNTVCIAGLSKAPSQNSITFVHQSLIGSFVVDNTTGRIYAVQFNTICGIASTFLKEQPVERHGRNAKTAASRTAKVVRHIKNNRSVLPVAARLTPRGISGKILKAEAFPCHQDFLRF